MYVLSGQSLAAADWFRPESMGLTLEERKSAATLTAGPEAPAVQVGAWMRDDQEPGNGIVWRVKSTENQYGTETRTITLEHIVNTLKDEVMFGEHGPKEITGNSSATTCTAKQAVQYILGKTNLWALGTFDSAYDEITNPYSFSGENLFAALETVTGSLEDAHWAYDLSALPFKLSIVKDTDDIESEMRMSRNIRTIRRTVDRTRMFTRLYPIGENNLHINGEYVSRNESTYGTICKIETESSKKTEPELKRWARERLKRHCKPTVTVVVDGLELSRDTGEPLDGFTICRKCRVPLPEFGTTITEKITKLQWSDKIREPDKVTVTLANNREDVATILNRQTAKSGGGARAKAKKDEEDHAWLDDTTDHVQMVAEAIIGQGPDGVDWSRVATLGVDGEGIHGRVTRAEGYIVTMQGILEMDEERFLLAFSMMDSMRSEFRLSAESLRIAFENDINCTRSEFLMTAESLRIGFENDLSSTRSEFLMTAESLRISFENDLASARSEFSMTAESLRIAFENDLSSTRSEFAMTAESLRIGFENDLASTRSEFQMTAESLRIDFENDLSSTRSEFLMTAESLRIAFENENTSLRSAIEVEAGRIGLIVEGSGSSASVKRAAIIASINRKTGASQVLIEANEIDIRGIVDDLKGYDIEAESLKAHQITSDGECSIDTLVVDNLQIGEYPVNVVDAQVSGNVLTITYADGETETFSKATTTSGSWSGRYYTARVFQNSTQVNSQTGIVYNGLVGTGEITLSGTTLYRDFIVYSDDGEGNADTTIMQKSVGISASSFLQEKTVNPDVSVVNVTPDSGKLGLSKVVVTAAVKQAKTVSPDVSAQEVTPDSGYYGLSKVTVTAAVKQAKTVSPDVSAQEVTPDSGYYGLSKVTVTAAVKQAKTVSPDVSAQDVTPDSGYYGLSKVTVTAAVKQAKTVNPGVSAQDVTPDSGYYGLSKVTVTAAVKQAKTASASTTQAVEVTPDSGYYGLSKVTINQINTQSKTVSPSTSAQTVLPDSGYLLSSVTVNAAADRYNDALNTVNASITLDDTQANYTAASGHSTINFTANHASGAYYYLTAVTSYTKADGTTGYKLKRGVRIHVNVPNSGITGLTRFYGANGAETPTLYYRDTNNNLQSAGAHKWYWKD